MRGFRFAFIFLTACTLLVSSLTSYAATFCDKAECSISLEFKNGGSISTPTQVSLIFGTDASMSLGSGGSVTVGDNGSLVGISLENFSNNAPIPNGSVINLDNGVIRFGPGGWIKLGVGGNIQYNDSDTLSIADASSVTVQGDNAWVTIGSFNLAGAVNLTATSTTLFVTGINTGAGVTISNTDTVDTVEISAAKVIVNGEINSAGQLGECSGAATNATSSGSVITSTGSVTLSNGNEFVGSTVYDCLGVIATGDIVGSPLPASSPIIVQQPSIADNSTNNKGGSLSLWWLGFAVIIVGRSMRRRIPA